MIEVTVYFGFILTLKNPHFGSKSQNILTFKASTVYSQTFFIIFDPNTLKTREKVRFFNASFAIIVI